MDERLNILASLLDGGQPSRLQQMAEQPRASSNLLREIGRDYIAQMAGDRPAGTAANILMGLNASPAVTRLPQGALAALRADILARNPGLRLWMGQAPSGHLTVSEIVVPQAARGQGVGTSVMQELTQFADQNGLPMALSPDGAFGGSVSRLRDFYSRFGFQRNAGRGRDLSISETMIRPPVE